MTDGAHGVGAVYRLDGVTVTRGATEVLRAVHLDLAPGEVLAVRGVSGSGKSTLLAVIGGLLSPSGGATWFGEQRFDVLPDAARAAIRLRSFGLVFQEGALIPELTLAENITLPLRLTGTLPRGHTVPGTVRAVVERLGIAGLLDRLPTQVSGGELQRAAVARAVVHRPALVLADEPTASLDEDTARDALTLLLDLARDIGAAVVIVTHDAAIAARCDRVVRLRSGVLAATPEDMSVGGSAPGA